MTSVIVTRPKGRRDPLVEALEAVGIAVHAVPTVRRESVADTGPLRRALAALASDDWIVITSPAAVEVLAASAAAMPPRPRGRTGPLPARLAVVGPGTASAARDAGLPVVHVAEPPSVEGVVAGLALSGLVVARRCLLLRADIGDARLAGALRSAGALVSEVVAYRTIEGPDASREPLARALRDPALGAAVFASGSAVRGYIQLAGDSLGTSKPARCAVTIGPSTTRAAVGHGLTVLAEASAPGVDELVDAVLAACAPSINTEALS